MSIPTPTFDLSTVPEHDRQRVADLIPDPRIADFYVHRDIDGINDFDLLDGAVSLEHNVLLLGPTGSSKTTYFRSYAARRGMPLAIVECSANMDPKTEIGRTKINPVTREPDWVDGPMLLVVRYGGVVVFDEGNMAHPRITAAWHGLTSVLRRINLTENGEVVAAGRGGTGEAQPVLLGLTMNPNSYVGTVRMNPAFRNRFPMPIEWPYLREVEEQMVESVTLLDMAEKIRSLAEVQSPCSTNMLIEFERHAHMFGYSLAAKMFRNHFDDDEASPVERALEANQDLISEELGIGFAAIEAVG